MAGRVENLKPKTTAKARGKLGGIKSGKVKKEKKLLSMIYAELLADQAGIKGGKGFKEVVREIMNSNDPRAVSARVSMMKEIREATEGSKSQTETTLNINTDEVKVADILARHGVSKSKD